MQRILAGGGKTRLQFLGQDLDERGNEGRHQQGFRVVDVDRVLTYWSVTRDLPKDIGYTTYVPSRINKIESDLPNNAITTAYSGYTKYFGDTPFHYNKVYVYAKPGSIKKRYRLRPEEDPNLLVLKSDVHLKKLSSENVVP